MITDVCVLPAYEHKNCGAVEGGAVRNDPLLELIGRVAVSHAEARADLHERASIPLTQRNHVLVVIEALSRKQPETK